MKDDSNLGNTDTLSQRKGGGAGDVDQCDSGFNPQKNKRNKRQRIYVTITIIYLQNFPILKTEVLSPLILCPSLSSSCDNHLSTLGIYSGNDWCVHLV